MPDLPPVSEDFTADASGYIAAIQSMIDETERLISTVGDAISKINDLNAAIKLLPDQKNIDVSITGDAIETIQAIKDDLNDLDNRVITVNVVYRKFGDVPDTVTEDITQLIKQVVVPAQGATVASDVINSDSINEAADAMGKFDNEATLAAVDARALEAGISRINAAYREMSVATDDARESLIRLAQAIVAGNVSNKPGAPVTPIEASSGSSEDLTQAAGAVNQMRTELGQLNAVTATTLADQKALANAINNTDDDMRLLAAGVNIAANANNVMRSGVSDLHDSFDVLYPEVQRTSSSMAGLVIPGGMIVAFFTQWGTLIHWVISGSAELLAVAIPALVALGAAALVAAQAAANVQARLTSMYTVAEALGPATNQTIGSMLGLGSSIQKAQTAMQPQLYEIYGAAIDGLKGHLGGLAQIGSQVIGIFTTFAAKMDVELQGALGTQLTGLISKAVPDLVEFGQVFGNLGHAIINFASAMPGLAEVLLKVLDAFSELVKIISEIPAPILTAAMALEEFLRWGSAINGMIAFMIGSFGKLIGSEGLTGVALAMKGLKTETVEATGEMAVVNDEANAGVVSFGGFARTILSFVAENPLAALAIAVVAAFTVFTVWVMRAQSATDQWVGSMQKAITSAPNYSQMNLTLQALSATTKQQASDQAVLNTKTSEWSALASGAQENVTAVTQANRTFNEEIVTESTNVAYLAKALGVSAPTAIGIMQGAGVKLTDTLQGNSQAAEVNRQKIDNLLTAYQTLGQSGTQLVADINAVSIASSEQLSNVQKLNQAWQTFIGLGVSAQSDFIAFEQGLKTIANDAGAAGASFNGLNSQSLTLRNDFENNITTMAKSLGDLNTGLSFGAISWNQYQTAVATEVKEMMGAGNLSAAQVSQLGLVASAAGYTGNSYSGLKNWVDKYAGSSTTLNGIINATTIGLSNQNSMMEQLQGTLQSDVINSTDQAILSQGGYTEQLTKTIAAAKDAGTGSADYKNNLKDLDSILKSAGASQQTINSINEDLGKTYKDVGKSAGDSIDNVKNLGGALGAQGVAANGLQDQIKNVFIAIGHYMGSSLTGMLKEAGDSFKDFWDGTVSIAKVGADLLTGNWSGAWNALKSAASSIGDSILSGIKSIFDQIAPIVEIPWDAIPASWRKAVTNAMSAVMNVLTPAWNTMVSDAKTAFNNVANAMTTAWNNVVNFAKGVWDGVKNAAITAWQATIGFIQSLGDKFSTWWSQHGNELKQLWGEVWSFMVTATDMATAAIRGTITIFWGVVVDLAKTAWNILGPIVSAGWALIRTLFTTGASLVETVATTMWNAVTQTAREAWAIIEPLIKAGWSDIVTSFDIFGAAVKAVWNELWSIAVTILKTTWDAIVAILKVGWDLVVGLFNVFLDLITGHWSQAWNDIKSTGEQIWNAISTFFEQAWHNYSDLFDQTWNNIKNFFVTTWDDIYSNAKSTWNDIMGFFRGIWSDITSGFSNTVSSISRVWGTLEGIFKGPVSFLVNTVYDNGIARLWNDVMSKIGGIPLPTFKFAGGAKIPGFGGGDIVPAMLEPGEAVVPKHLVSGVAPFLGAHGVPGFAKGGYVDPFLGHPIPERIDQGVDFSGALDIVAIGDARIVETSGGGWPGGPYMAYQLTDGTDAGRYIYIAENIIPDVAVGQVVKAGQVIAKMFNGGDGIEMGWAAPGGGSPLSQTPGAGGISGANLPPDSATAVGHDFDAFLTSLGVEPAPNFNSPPAGKLPPGMGASQPGAVNPIGGGVFGAIINGVWQAITGTISGLGDAASAIAAIATGNTTALVNDMLKLVGNGSGGGAKDDLAKMMVGLPTTLVKDAMKWFVGEVQSHTGQSQPTGGTPTSGPPGGANGSEMQNGIQIYQYLLKNLFGGNKIAAAGAIASIWGESTWNPFAVGGGGNGLIGWSFPPLNAAELAGGMRTQLPLILQFVTSSGDSGVIAEMFRATSVLQAANEWGVGVERFGINDVHAEGVALATQIMQTHDGGGWIYPGLNLIQNKTGGIERTVGPNENVGGGGMMHAVINVDGKSLFDAMVPYGYQKAARNNGNANSNRYYASGNG